MSDGGEANILQRGEARIEKKSVTVRHYEVKSGPRQVMPIINTE